MASQLTALIIGRLERVEVLPFVEGLSATIPQGCWIRYRSLAPALDDLASTSAVPDLVVIVQSWPDEFSAQEITRLLAFAPLARIVVAYGAWCESDGRTRHLWPQAVRVPLTTARSRVEREWLLLNGRPGLVPLPMSATREEVFVADAGLERRTTPGTSVAVETHDSGYRRYLTERLSAETAIIINRASPGDDLTSNGEAEPTDLIFDADPWTEGRATDLQQIRNRWPQTKITAMTNHLLPEACSEIMLAGADIVLEKLSY